MPACRRCRSVREEPGQGGQQRAEKLSERLAAADRRDAEIHTTGRTESTPRSGRPATWLSRSRPTATRSRTGITSGANGPKRCQGTRTQAARSAACSAEGVAAKVACPEGRATRPGEAASTIRHHRASGNWHMRTRARGPKALAESVRTPDQLLSNQRRRAPFPLLQFYTLCHVNLTLKSSFAISVTCIAMNLPPEGGYSGNAGGGRRTMIAAAASANGSEA